MHPTYVLDHKGSCPICGMDLVPAADLAEPQGGAASTVPGMAAVALSEEAIRLAGVRTAEAVREQIGSTIRTVGIVTADESRVRHVHTKISGWVEKLAVSTAGHEVRKDDPIVTIYSPELLAGQEELLEAGKALAAAQGDEARRSAEMLVEAARRRLRLFDVPEGFLEDVERTGQASRTVTLRAPFNGVVTTLDVFAGQAVNPEDALYTLTDLSQVWIEGNFYENEARTLELEQAAELTLPYDPSVSLSGTVDFIYPYLDPQSRTIKVRFVFANDFGLLKPGMYANVTLAGEQGESVVVPDNAILSTGERSLVFVAGGEGVFTPREVEVGVRTGGRAQILSGVEAGERVVIKANFLLDSESRIRAALSGSGQTPAGGAMPATPAGSAVPETRTAGGSKPGSEPTPSGHQHGGMC
jgi:RND family efflux transporter MFP subunit